MTGSSHRVTEHLHGAEVVRAMQEEQRSSPGYDPATNTMGPPFTVTYARHEENPEIYVAFTLEPYLLEWMLTRAIDNGELTHEEAREAWYPYRTFDPDLYDPTAIEEGIWPYAADSVEIVEPRWFFEELIAIDGPSAGYDLSGGRLSPMSGLQFEIRGADTLRKVEEQLAGKYIFVLVEDRFGGWFSLPLEAVQREIRLARERGSRLSPSS